MTNIIPSKKMREIAIRFLRFFRGYNPQVFVITSKELEDLIGREIETFKETLSYRTFIIKHRNQYKIQYGNIETAEAYYKQALNNLFEVLTQQVMRGTIVVIPSYGLADVLKEHIAPMVAKNHSIVYPSTFEQNSTSIIFKAHAGLREHAIVLPNNYSGQGMQIFALLSMSLATQLHNENLKLITLTETSLEIATIISLFMLSAIAFRFITHKPLMFDSHYKKHISPAKIRQYKDKTQRQYEKKQLALELRTIERKNRFAQKTAAHQDIDDTVSQQFTPLLQHTKARKTRKKTESSSTKNSHPTETAESVNTADNNYFIGNVNKAPEPDLETTRLLLQNLTEIQLNDLYNFLNRRPDAILRKYTINEMIDFLARLGCDTFGHENKQHHNKQHHRVQLPDGETISSLILESNSRKHDKGAAIHKVYFDDLHKSLDNIGASKELVLEILTDRLEKRREQDLKNRRLV